jgi:phosphatidylglycerophosphatase A
MPPTAESQSPSSITPSEPIARPSFIVNAFASGLFTGYSPIASGTVASGLALLVYFIPGFEHPGIMITACFFTFILGVKASAIMELCYGHDPAEATIDEVLGMWVSLILLPKMLGVAVTAFFIFRLMDILKPFPARRFDKATGGLGIMLDDVVAALYTNLILHIALVNETVRNFLFSF